mmetsp:Transcript_17838/g.31006  ORF Transcript_17838/g.31006 Transcript_17838/m.31006 type:complete len:109 (-) Transcript_17838:770-1096(-)
MNVNKEQQTKQRQDPWDIPKLSMMNLHASLYVSLKRIGVDVIDSNQTFDFLKVPLAKYRVGRSPSRLSLTTTGSRQGSRKLDYAPSPYGSAMIRLPSSGQQRPMVSAS